MDGAKKYMWIIQYVIFAFIALNAWRTNDKLTKTGLELSQVNMDYNFLEATLADTENELKSAYEDFNKLKSAFSSAQPKLDLGVQMKEGRKAVSDTLLGRHDAQAQRIVDLQKKIQEIHLQDLKNR